LLTVDVLIEVLLRRINGHLKATRLTLIFVEVVLILIFCRLLEKLSDGSAMLHVVSLTTVFNLYKLLSITF
jgi:hypothetical protein